VEEDRWRHEDRYGGLSSAEESGPWWPILESSNSVDSHRIDPRVHAPRSAICLATGSEIQSSRIALPISGPVQDYPRVTEFSRFGSHNDGGRGPRMVENVITFLLGIRLTPGQLGCLQ
jgi:hypothetical protein